MTTSSLLIPYLLTWPPNYYPIAVSHHRQIFFYCFFYCYYSSLYLSIYTQKLKDGHTGLTHSPSSRKTWLSKITPLLSKQALTFSASQAIRNQALKLWVSSQIFNTSISKYLQSDKIRGLTILVVWYYTNDVTISVATLYQRYDTQNDNGTVPRVLQYQWSDTENGQTMVQFQRSNKTSGRTMVQFQRSNNISGLTLKMVRQWFNSRGLTTSVVWHCKWSDNGTTPEV